MALSLLLFAFADISFPQVFCGAELVAGDPRAFANEGIDRDSVVKAFSSPGSDGRRDESPGQVPHDEEDCFCCCAHVIPADAFSVAAALTPVPVTFAARYSSHHPPPLRSPYRPPRSA